MVMRPALFLPTERWNP